jgi:hypothetical protein
VLIGVIPIKDRLLTRGQFHQHVYKQLFQEQIPKAQKDNQVIIVFLRFYDLPAFKAACIHVDEIDLRGIFNAIVPIM